ncbi:MAG: hypothetical protein AAB263_00490 [Planctomycetota bacterium]
MLASFNAFVLRHIATIEMIGVLMRITCFGMMSFMNKDSPFLFVWIFNTIDAIMLSWCSVLRRDRAYTTLNVFWILVGINGIVQVTRAAH